MATNERGESSAAAGQPARDDQLRYFSRQPILNATGHVHGYELLFRNGPKPGHRRDCGEAVETMLDSAVMFGLEGLTNGMPAFVACTEEALVKELVLVLTPRLMVLCLPASSTPSDKLVEALRKLKFRGYRIALDDFCWHDKLQPLVEQAD